MLKDKILGQSQSNEEDSFDLMGMSPNGEKEGEEGGNEMVGEEKAVVVEE